MANTIKLKRGSGSDPTSSDLAVGELAIRTDEGKIFTKKDDGSVAEISGGGGGEIVDDTSPQLGGNLDVNTKNILFGDSASASDDRLIFGAGSDLSIHSDGQNGVIRQNNDSGGLYLQTDNFLQIGKVDQSTPIYAKFVNSGACELYFDGSKTAETVSGGFTVTGTCTATTFSGSGASLTSLSASQLSGTLPAISGTNLTTLNASNLSSGTVSTARLGSGTASSSTFLRGDGSWTSAADSTKLPLAGGTVTGQISLTNNSAYPLNINNSHDGKINLQGSNNPYIQFREGTSGKAYIQWSTSGYLTLVNEESGDQLKIDDGASGLIWRVGTTDYTVWNSGNDGSGSGLDADTLDGQEGSYYTNASNLSSGTIPNARLATTVDVTALTAVTTTVTTSNATSFVGSGDLLTSLRANQLTSGTIPDARFPATLPAANGSNLTSVTADLATSVTVTANNGNNENVYLAFVDSSAGGTQGIETDAALSYNPSTNALTAGSFSGDLNATSLASGTVPTARLGSGTASSSTFLRGDNTWASVSASPGGSNTQIQYNSSGSFAGSSNLTFDGTNLTVGGTVSANSAASNANGMRKVTSSTSSPSGGSDGDIWIKYTN